MLPITNNELFDTKGLHFIYSLYRAMDCEKLRNEWECEVYLVTSDDLIEKVQPESKDSGCFFVLSGEKLSIIGGNEDSIGESLSTTGRNNRAIGENSTFIGKRVTD